MHDIEPYYNWRHLYIAEEDEKSPFFGREHSEFEFTQTVYNYYIHPQWDDFGSRTLYVKSLFVEYDQGFCILEFIGEWNDAIENDIMILKRELIDRLVAEGVKKFILIGENILNFHSSDSCYYEEWFEDIQDDGGWIAILDLPEQSQYDFKKAKINRYIELLDYPGWRTVLPQHLFTALDNHMLNRLELK